MFEKILSHGDLGNNKTHLIITTLHDNMSLKLMSGFILPAKTIKFHCDN